MKWMRKLKDRAALPKNVQYANMPGESAARKNEIMVRTKSCGGICLNDRVGVGKWERREDCGILCGTDGV